MRALLVAAWMFVLCAPLTRAQSWGERPSDFDAVQVPVDEPARLAEPLEIEYPDAAVRRRLEGVVIVAVAIDRSGVLVYAEVRRSSGHAVLDSAALVAVRRADFRAAKRGGERVASRASIPIEYRLAGGETWDVEKTPDELKQDTREIEQSKQMIDAERARIDAEIRRLRDSLRTK